MPSVDAYLREVDIPAAIASMKHEAAGMGGLRGRYLASLSDCLTVMWGLAMEILGNGPAVPYERCVVASTAQAPESSQPQAKCDRVAELLARAGYKSADRDGLLAAVDAWRRERTVPMGSVKAMGAAVIAQFEQFERRCTWRPTCRRNSRVFRARTSSFCPSRTRGSPAR